MTLLTEPTRIVLRRGWQPMDPDAAAYIAAVEAADTQALEERTKIAIDNFVLGCKADGIWTAIKASCILAGARTRLGALTPLVGTAPTSFNFVDGDYNRKTGLVGDGSTKYLDSNRNNTVDPQNSRHLSAYSTFKATLSNRFLIGMSGGIAGRSRLGTASSDLLTNLSDSSNATTANGYVNGTGLIGLSRSASDSYTVRYSLQTTLQAVSSVSPGSGSLQVFASAGASFSNARLAFYSVGESLDLARLDGRVTDLINAFGAAIP